MKCDNCPEIAVYELRKPPQKYCADHLPWFIKLYKDLGTKVFEINTTPTKQVEEPVVEPVAVVEELVAEEVVVEEVEKKPIKKKA